MSDFKKYEYIIKIAECGGISSAADKLNISQPTLSKYVKKLEKELGLELFDRSTAPVRPTKAGKCYIEAGKKLIYVQKQLNKQLGEIKSEKGSVIRVGISPSRSPYMMPAIVEAYKAKNPCSKIVIEEKTTAELAGRLERGELDIVINLLDENTERFEGTELFSEDILLAVKKSAWVEEDAISIMLNTPLISVGRGQAMWYSLHNLAERIGARSPEIECQSIESALSLVKRGLGAMLVPSYIAEFGSEEENKELCFLPLPEEEKCRDRRVCLFYRKEQFLSKAEQDFISCVIATVNKIKI